MQFLLAHGVGWYLSFALRTTRWTIEGVENLAPYVLGSPAIMASWHERLPLMPMQWIEMQRLASRAGKVVRIHILISRSRDGRFIGTLVSRFGIDVLSGSTSRGGAVANAQAGGVAERRRACWDHAGWSARPATTRCPGRGPARGTLGRADSALRRANVTAMGVEKLGQHGHPKAVRPGRNRLRGPDLCRSRGLARRIVFHRSGLDGQR